MKTKTMRGYMIKNAQAYWVASIIDWKASTLDATTRMLAGEFGYPLVCYPIEVSRKTMAIDAGLFVYGGR